jgi:hypothetical protein
MPSTGPQSNGDFNPDLSRQEPALEGKAMPQTDEGPVGRVIF